MSVFLQSVSSPIWFNLEKQSCLSHEFLVDELRKNLGITSNNVPCKFFQGHAEILPGSCRPWPETDVFIQTTISLVGGKGGFGSMLRAIGAQIEKTTNREACRDLSGRRLRDINEEKRLKDWVSKQAEREQEKEARKQKKLEKLRQEFHHEFEDPEYFKARSEVTDKVYEALEQGIQASSSSSAEPVTKKRKADEKGPAMKKTALWVGVSDDELDSSEDDEKEASSSSDSNKDSNETKTVIAVESSNEEQMELKPVAPVDIITAIIPSEPVIHSELEKEKTSTTKQEAVPAAPEQSSSSEPVAIPPPVAPEPTSFEPVNLEDFNSAKDLEALGLNHLKHELTRRGLKCGGALPERASRLFSVKGLSLDQVDPTLLAKPQKKK